MPQVSFTEGADQWPQQVEDWVGWDRKSIVICCRNEHLKVILKHTKSNNFSGVL